MSAATILGVDFTSRPCSRKPITVASASLCDGALVIHEVLKLASFDEFEGFLNSGESWLAGLDFPFGQPRRLVESLDWPRNWEQYVTVVACMEKSAFVQLLRDYQDARPPGDKRHLRAVDRAARSLSPMQVDFVPLAQMFYEGAPRLLKSGCNVYPFIFQSTTTRSAIEAYPALVARNLLTRRVPYKAENSRTPSGHLRAGRQLILEALTGRIESRLKFLYAISVLVPEEIEVACLDDHRGDCLDALLCAVQAAWAYQNRDNGHGVPPQYDPLEGWIADPSLQAPPATGTF